MQKIDGCEVSTATSVDKIIENIEKHRAINGLEVSNMPDWRYNKPIALVGGGPSLKETIQELNYYQDIMICGSSHDYVVDNLDRSIKYCVVCDPDPLVLEYIKRPRLDTKYLLATQCDPVVFEYLKNYQNYKWNAGGAQLDNKIFGDNATIMGGGCTVGTRAINLAIGFGYTNIHLFGFDTCLAPDFKHHAYDFVDPEKESLGNIHEISLDGPTGKKFYLAGYMLGQLFDFQQTLKLYGHFVKFTVHGDGILKHLMDLAISKVCK